MATTFSLLAIVLLFEGGFYLVGKAMDIINGQMG